jgi:HD-like signal output (HDOD) protein
MLESPVTKEQRLKRVRNYLFRMPSLSTTVTKVMEICNDPKTSPNDLNRVISLDPVLTGRVLKIVNSAYFSPVRKISSLTRAIIMLGINTVKNLALSTSILTSMGRKESFHALSMDDFWAHSICVGVTAKSLAAIKNIPISEREEYFVAGMLHDLGKIPLNNLFQDEYAKVLELAKIEKSPLYLAEKMILEIDHAMIGGMIAEKWQLGEIITDSLSHHHEAGKVRAESFQVVAITSLANEYANMAEIGSAGDTFSEEPKLTYLLDRVGISWSTLSDISESILEEIEKAKIFLQIS